MYYKYQSVNTADTSSSFSHGNEVSSSLDITAHLFQMAKQNRNAPAARSNSRRSEFLASSQQLEQEIKRLTKQLSMLKEMNRKSTLFTNDDSKINELITDVKQEMTAISKKVLDLEKVNDLIYSKQAEKMAKSITEILNLRLMDITKDFKLLLEGRTNNLKQFKEKESFLSLAGSKATEVRNRKTENAFLKKPFGHNMNRRGNPGLEYDQGGAADDGSGHHEIQIGQVNGNLDQVRRKNDAARAIQKSLEEVMGIFTRISSMVQLQEIMIERIDKDMDDSLRNVEGGKKNLVKIYKDVSSTRRLIITVMIFLMIFGAVYILII